ncbi:MAG: ABC transporter substrate-binding protein [Clostridia bacterium]|nr:ABC transporter substrate-binding protein [Clostridia bacterium]
MKRRAALVLTLILIIVSLCGCTPKATPEKGDFVVTDSVGREVSIPENPQSVCTLCPFSGPIIVMLGSGDKITSFTNNAARSRLLMQICPSLENAVVVKNSGSVNAEEIMARNTDLIILNSGVYEDSTERAKIDAMGIPYIVIDYNTVEDQLEAVEILGKTFGNTEKAEEYISYFRSVIDRAQKGAQGTPKRLYHSVNEAVRTDYEGSYCAEWTALTGVENVSVESGKLSIEGEKAYTTLEQIYAWNPDIIICNEAQVDDYILSDSKWQGLSCVQNGEVYQIPIGITRWGHPSSFETPLAILWLMNLLYPDTFEVDMNTEIKTFYKNFFGFEINDEWLGAIIEGTEMREPKTEHKEDAA